MLANFENNFLWRWTRQISGRTKWKHRDKTGKCSVSQDFEKGFLSIVPEWPPFYHFDPTDILSDF